MSRHVPPATTLLDVTHRMLPIFKNAALCLASALCAVGFYAYWDTPTVAAAPDVRPQLANYARPVIERARGEEVSAAALYPNFINAAAAVTPAVVNIKSLSGGGLDDLWNRERRIDASSGSGVIISADGYIVTNNHVIAEGTDVEVTLDDRREYEAEVVGRDPSTDLALLRIEAEGLPFVSFGNSDSLYVGEWVLAVGNPFDLRSTVTAGIVSAKGRSIDILDDTYSIESFIQTDAAVNPGNSGGALVNTSGQLMGINTAIITRSGRYEGYSFAVPSSLAAKVVDDLIEFGTVQHALLGIELVDLDNSQAEDLGLATADGVYVRKVAPASAAADAGLLAGDVVVRIEDVEIRSVPALKETIGRFRPGETVRLAYFRGGQLSTVRVTLKNASGAGAETAHAHQELMRDLGFELRDLTPAEMGRAPSPGVKVISIFLGSKIDRTRMDPEYVITKVNHQTVESVDEFARVVSATDEGDDVLLEGYYESYSGEYYYAFKR